MSYTTIWHEPRKKYGLSCNDYCVADLIYHLANNPSNEYRWCYATRQAIADMIGLSKVSVMKIIEGLIEKGLIEVHPQTKQLRTTLVWFEEFVHQKIDGKESLPTVKNLNRLGKESLPPIYKDDNNSNNNINTGQNEILPPVPPQAVKEEKKIVAPKIAYPSFVQEVSVQVTNYSVKSGMGWTEGKINHFSENFLNKHKANGWRLAKGGQIKDWIAHMQNYMRSGWCLDGYDPNRYQPPAREMKTSPSVSKLFST